MLTIGKGAERQIDNIKMTRYACYLCVQNADPSKPIVAQAQTYFAIQTRRAEVILDKDVTLTQEEQKRLMLREKIQGKDAANRTHREVGAKVRQAIKDIGGTMPEDLPTVDSINFYSILGLTWLF